MTAFGITICIFIVYFITVFLYGYLYLGPPCDIEDWVELLGHPIIIDLIIFMIGVMLFGIGLALYNIDWEGFFNDKIF